MSSPRGLILFDIDGTLLRGAGQEHRAALLQGVHRITGFETSFEGIDTTGRLDRDLIAALLARTAHERDQLRDRLPHIVSECCSIYARNCGADLRHCVCPGVLAFLDRARSIGMVLGIVSGNLRAIGMKKLERAGLARYFVLGAFSEDGHTRAELARLAADEAGDLHGLDEWAPIFLIGDHMNDVEAAKANGFHSIAVGTGIVGLAQLQAAEPTMAVRDLTELHPARLMDLHGELRRELHRR